MDPVRDRLIAAATELLDQGGPANVTLRGVGRLAGVSHNAPYKHFRDKEALLAAVAARELGRQSGNIPGRARANPSEETLRQMMQAYVKWATRHPYRFKLAFGSWSTPSAELVNAANAARAALVGKVEEEQRTQALPSGDPERIASLILAVSHGAVDLALGGHLAADGKGHKSPSDLVDDLFSHLRISGEHQGR